VVVRGGKSNLLLNFFTEIDLLILGKFAGREAGLRQFC
jgi:hypothetical protein